MSDAGGVVGVVILDQIVPAERPWGHIVRRGEASTVKAR